MGLISSRLNLESLRAAAGGRRRSQQDEAPYSYSLNKNYFSNYFLIGGERFEANDPDYLFGDNCDLNFLSCAKPYLLPYKKAQQNILSNLSTKQKAINKVSSRVSRFSSPFNFLTDRDGQARPDSRKQDAQTQTSHGTKGSCNASEASQPLVMLVNIRKETLRLVKSAAAHNLDSDLNSLTNSISITTTKSAIHVNRRRTSSKKPQHYSSNRHSTASSRATTATIHPSEAVAFVDDDNSKSRTSEACPVKIDSDAGSLLSATSSIRSGYTSVKEDVGLPSDDTDEDFEDALNDTVNLSIKGNDEENQEENPDKTRPPKALLLGRPNSTKETRDVRITIESMGNTSASNSSDTASKQSADVDSCTGGEYTPKYSSNNSHSGSEPSEPKQTKIKPKKPSDDNNYHASERSTNRVYNIEFYFDVEVDCSIRIFYFCTRESTSNGITYKPQHATYKSRIYTYKKGLNQKFDQQEHTFQPYLFDEDLLIYKPLDLDGNYNTGAVFPIVIHCVALEGPMPRQSHSLVATIEKSQLDDSYSIKPLKQLIFADGVQYILQDIYGIEHKQLSTSNKSRVPNQSTASILALKAKSRSVQSNLDGSTLNISDAASMTSVDFNRQNRGSMISNQFKSLAGENNFECVICMSDERDTMLLPCRHLCLCSSCAQSLRYQASSCPICRCPFRAALNFRPILKRSKSNPSVETRAIQISKNLNKDHKDKDKSVDICSGNMNRRDSVTTSATPLLAGSAAPLDLVVQLDGGGGSGSVSTIATTSNHQQRPTTNTTDSYSIALDRQVNDDGEDGGLELKPMNAQWIKDN